MFNAPKMQETSDFYNKLIDRSLSRSLWGADQRFNPRKIADAPSTLQHYVGHISGLCRSHHRALDIGCSTGGFTGLLAEHCDEVIGVDLSENAVNAANSHFDERKLANCKALVGDACTMDLGPAQFDIIQMIDVVHHVENPVDLVERVCSLLKDDGRLIVFEPNKYNVALFLMCLLDPNEWGALKYGSKACYRALFSPYLKIGFMEYNGLLIGPGSGLALTIASYLSQPRRNILLASQSPKIVMVLKKAVGSSRT
jgi:2-polyprenyl-3-methyl-5-hydroxy-6-metoxy-1,4-benzoquinol methylase